MQMQNMFFIFVSGLYQPLQILYTNGKLIV